MANPRHGISDSERRQMVNILYGVLRQCIPSQKGEYLIKRAKHFEASSLKRATSYNNYFALINVGIVRIGELGQSKLAKRANTADTTVQANSVPLPADQSTSSPVQPAHSQHRTSCVSTSAQAYNQPPQTYLHSTDPQGTSTPTTMMPSSSAPMSSPGQDQYSNNFQAGNMPMSVAPSPIAMVVPGQTQFQGTFQQASMPSGQLVQQPSSAIIMHGTNQFPNTFPQVTMPLRTSVPQSPPVMTVPGQGQFQGMFQQVSMLPGQGILQSSGLPFPGQNQFANTVHQGSMSPSQSLPQSSAAMPLPMPNQLPNNFQQISMPQGMRGTVITPPPIVTSVHGQNHFQNTYQQVGMPADGSFSQPSATLAIPGQGQFQQNYQTLSISQGPVNTPRLGQSFQRAPSARTLPNASVNQTTPIKTTASPQAVAYQHYNAMPSHPSMPATSGGLSAGVSLQMNQERVPSTPARARNSRAKKQPRTPRGKSTVGKSTAGKSTAGTSVAGKSVAGKPTVGESTAGKSTSGESTSGKSTAGKSVAGKSVAGKPVAGKSVAGNSTASKSAASKATVGRPKKQRGRKRNAGKAGLTSPSPKVATNPSQNAVQTNTQAHVSASGHATASGSFPVVAQAPVRSPQTQHGAQTSLPQLSSNFPGDDIISLTNGLRVSISQIYAAAMSMGQRISSDFIRTLTSDQIMRILVLAHSSATRNIRNRTAQSTPQVESGTFHAGGSRQTSQNSKQSNGPAPGVPHQVLPRCSTQAGGPRQLPPSNGHVTVANHVQNTENCDNGMTAVNHNMNVQQAQSVLHQARGVGAQISPNQAPSQQPVSPAIRKVEAKSQQPTNLATPLAQIRGMNSNTVAATSQGRGPGATSGAGSGAGSSVGSGVGSSAGADAGADADTGADTGAEAVSGAGAGAVVPTTSLGAAVERHFLSMGPIDGVDGIRKVPHTEESYRALFIRLERFQRKYKAYLNGFQDTWAAMMQKEKDEPYYIRYMKYTLKLLTCPLEAARQFNEALLDKVETFLREYLVRFQGIREPPEAGASRKTRSTRVPEIKNQDRNSMKIPSHSTAGPSNAPARDDIRPASKSVVLTQPTTQVSPSMNSSVAPIASAPLSTAVQCNSHALDTANTRAGPKNSTAGQQGTQNSEDGVVVQSASRSQSAEIKPAQEEISEIVPNVPTASHNVGSARSNPTNEQPKQQSTSASGPSKNRTGTVKTPGEIRSAIARQIAQVGFYVKLAVHGAESLERNATEDSSFRFREERIGEAMFYLRNPQWEAPQGLITESLRAQPETLMDIVKQECEEVSGKHSKLVIDIKEEWNRPVVRCLLAFECIRLPQITIHVPPSYDEERWVRVAFEMPPFGWVGPFADIKEQYEKNVEEKVGVAGVLEAWVMAAEGILNDA